MKILIVDDLENVVRSIREGVDWKKLNVDEVFSAYSVEEAKCHMRLFKIDLMLCDIEMPPSDGFTLLQWAREQDEEIECIFLTSHAEFEYAQKAIKMGSFDYILQPARYSDIESAVRKAIDRILEKRLEKGRAQFGRYWQDKSRLLGEASLERFLNRDGMGLCDFLEELQQLGFLISESTELCQILFQMHRDIDHERIETLRRLFIELLGRNEHNMLTLNVQRDSILVVLFGGNDRWGEVAAVLEQMLDKWHHSFDGPRPACYIGGTTSPDGIYPQWVQLRDRMRKNVASYGGVFVCGQREEIPGYTYLFPDMKNWAKCLEIGQCDHVREEVTHYLMHEREKGRCTAEFLVRFYQDFTQMFFIAVGAGVQRNTLSLPENLTFDSYVDAFSSFDRMIEMVGSVLGTLKEHVCLPKAEDSPIRKAVEYIRANIEKDLHCSDVSREVFMNEDHISRLFKKELGVSLYNYIISEKIRTAGNLLVHTNLPVSIIASKVGYPNFSYFSQVFKKQTGMTPNEYRSENRNT